MPSLKITQQNIADALNISRATVNKVFTNKPLPEKVRETVLEKARELGYCTTKATKQWGEPAHAKTPNARSAGLILLVCFQPESEPHQAGAITSRWKLLASGMERACSEYGYRLIVSILAGSYEEAAQLLNMYTLNQVEGSILCGSSSRINTFLKEITGQSPTVIADADDLGYLKYVSNDVLAYDILGAMNEIVTHFAKAGHKRIAYIGQSAASNHWDEHTAGVLYGCIENGVEGDISFLNDCQPGQPWQALFEQKITAGDRLPTAFICASDKIALDVKAILERHGHRVPDDFSISGFDSAGGSQLGSGIPTTVFFREELGYSSVEQLLYRIRNPHPPYLIIRQRLKVVF